MPRIPGVRRFHVTRYAWVCPFPFRGAERESPFANALHATRGMPGRSPFLADPRCSRRNFIDHRRLTGIDLQTDGTCWPFKTGTRAGRPGWAESFPIISRLPRTRLSLTQRIASKAARQSLNLAQSAFSEPLTINVATPFMPNALLASETSVFRGLWTDTLMGIGHDQSESLIAAITSLCRHAILFPIKLRRLDSG